MSNTSSSARLRNSSLMGSGTSQNYLQSKRGHSSVYNQTLSSQAKMSNACNVTASASTVAHSRRSSVPNGTARNLTCGGAPGGAVAGSFSAGHSSSVNNTKRTETLRRNQDLIFPNDPKLKDNLKFYRNEIKSKPWPGGMKIEEMLTKWKGDYIKLEYEHQYIQWLFPLPEGRGLNSSAQPLQQHEAIEIQSDKYSRLRVLKAYRMMLDFYGLKLHSSESGEVVRSDNNVERFNHLNRSTHNYRRITRIIKSIGCLGYGHLQAPLVRFLINEACVEKTLSRVSKSSMYHWIDAIADDKEKEETMNFFLKVCDGVNYDLSDLDVEEAVEAMEQVGYRTESNVDTGQVENPSGDMAMHADCNSKTSDLAKGGASNTKLKDLAAIHSSNRSSNGPADGTASVDWDF